MTGPFEKLKRTVTYHYYRKKNGWTFPSNMAHITGGNIALGTYEPEVSKIVEKKLKKGSLFIDVGANVGYFAQLGAKVVGTEGRVFAFEAEPENFYSLTQNIQGLTNTVPLNLAVSDKNSFLSINHSSHSSCHSIVDTANHLDGSRFNIPTISLDHFWKEYLNKASIDLIKVDVEGAEMIVLSGMNQLLSENSVRSMIIEFCPKIMRNADISVRDFYNLLSTHFSISVIDREFKSIVRNGAISEFSDFDLLSNHLLGLDGVVNINLLCQ